MIKADFEASPSGRLVATEGNHWAFVPNDLPPVNIDYACIAEPLANAAQMLGELNGTGRTLTNPLLLIRPFQTREALASSSMEGTYSTFDDLALIEAGAPEADNSQDTREVINYRRALTEALASLDKLPLSIRTLCDAHRVLLDGMRRHRGFTARPGELKIHQNFIGGREIKTARFVPPPPLEASNALGQLEKFIHRHERAGIPHLVESALIHYQFETIHPFADGNGRVGRMLITLHLAMRGALRQPLLYLSPVLENRKDEYIDRMFDVSRRGDWIGWITFFLDVVIQSCAQTIEVADALLALHREFRQRASGAGRSSNLLTLVDHLFQLPVVTIPQVAELLDVTYRSAQLNVEALVKEGILKSLDRTSNPKYYMATEIAATINKRITDA